MTKISLNTLIVMAIGLLLANCANKTTNGFGNTLNGKFTDRLTALHDISDLSLIHI